MYVYPEISTNWLNHSNLTATSPTLALDERNHPKMTKHFRFVCCSRLDIPIVE